MKMLDGSPSSIALQTILYDVYGIKTKAKTSLTKCINHFALDAA